MPSSGNRNPFLLALRYCLAGVLAVTALAAGISSAQNNARPLADPVLTARAVRVLLQLDPRMGRAILRQGIPLLKIRAGEDDPDPVWPARPKELFLQWALNIRYPSPQEMVRAQLPILEWRTIRRTVPERPTAVVAAGLEIVPEPSRLGPTPAEPDNPPLVLIYHTHTSECYLPVSGVEHRFNQRGDIVAVGKYLADELRKLSVPTLHSEKIHDQYPFRDSYQRSQQTIVSYLERDPSLRIILDVHRDGAAIPETSPVIEGQRTARIMFVVGSDHMGLPHPHWRKNYQFALELADLLNRRYPGLVNRVIVSDARYNQHLHEHALLVEIGDQNTPLAEAERSVLFLAEALRDYLYSHPFRTENQPSRVEETVPLEAVASSTAGR